MNKIKKIYFKRGGILLHTEVDEVRSDIKEQLEEVGLVQLRAILKADLNSPIIVIAK